MKFILATALLTLSITAFSQLPDTNDIRALVQHAIVLYPDKTDSIHYYANYIRDESQRLGFRYGETYAYRLRGTYYRFNDNFDSAIVYFQLFLQHAIKHNNKMAEWLANIDVAETYMHIGQYQYAKSLYIKTLALTPGINPSAYDYAHLYNAMAASYQYLGILDTAEHYYRAAMLKDLEVNDSTRRAERQSNLSEVLMERGMVEEAEKNLLESFSFNQRHNITDALWFNYNNLGKLNLIKNEYALSERYFKQAYDQAANTSTKFKIVDALEGISSMHRKKGDFRKALEYKLQADSIAWIIAAEKRIKHFSELEERHKTSKKEKENYRLLQDLETEVIQKHNLSLIIVALTLVVIGITVALYSNMKKKNLLALQNNIISKQKEKLQELNTEKNDLISYVSHDLGTPLVNIGLCAQSLEQKMLTARVETKQLDLIKNIKDSADYGYDLIQYILNIEAVESGFQKLEITSVALRPLIEEVVSHFAETARTKQINLIVDTSSATNNLMTDKKHLQRILENLLSNAFKFSPPGKTVWIKTQQQNNNTDIYIKDEGPGISSEERKKLFTRYSRLSSKPTGDEKSMGLGLYIVKRLADELKAQVQLQSTPGVGTSFSIHFSG